MRSFSPFKVEGMRRLKLPFFLLLVVAVLLGIAWGLKIQKNTAKRKAPESDATTLKVLAFKNTFPTSVIRAFEGQANVKVQLVEEATPETLMAHLDRDQHFDIVTLLNHQTFQAASTLKIQPLKLTDISGANSISSDFLDLPGASSPSVIPILWGLNGFATDDESQKKSETWTQLLSAKVDGGLSLKPSVMSLAILTQIVSGSGQTDAAFTDRAKQLSAQNSHTTNFMASSSDFDLERGGFQVSHGEALFPPFAESAWRFQLPTDGVELWILSLSLGSKAENSEGAKKFIEFLLKPASAGVLSTQAHQASCNKGVEKLTKVHPGLKPSYLRTVPLERLKLANEKTIERTKLIR